MDWDKIKPKLFYIFTGDPVYLELLLKPKNERKGPVVTHGLIPTHHLYNFDYTLITKYIKNIYNFIYQTVWSSKTQWFNSTSCNQTTVVSSLYLDLKSWLSQHGGFLYSSRLPNSFVSFLKSKVNFYLHEDYKYFLFNKSSPVYWYRAELNSIKYDSFFYISLTIFSFLSLLAIVWFIDFFSRINNKLFKNEKIFDDYNTNVNYLVESEKELGSLDDMFLGISIFICIYGWFFGANFIFYSLNYSESYFIYVGFPILLLIVLGMPFNMIWDYGLTFVTFLRGSSNTTIFSLEFMYDLLATAIMFIRLVVQNVRYLLMFFAFLEFFEFFASYSFLYEDMFYSSDKTFFDFMSTTNLASFFFNNFAQILTFSVLYIYNMAHLLYTVLSHFFAYLILVFWFFSFLYTTFFYEKLENFFKFKRNNKK